MVSTGINRKITPTKMAEKRRVAENLAQWLRLTTCISHETRTGRFFNLISTLAQIFRYSSFLSHAMEAPLIVRSNALSPSGPTVLQAVV